MGSYKLTVVNCPSQASPAARPLACHRPFATHRVPRSRAGPGQDQPGLCGALRPVRQRALPGSGWLVSGRQPGTAVPPARGATRHATLTSRCLPAVCSLPRPRSRCSRAASGSMPSSARWVRLHPGDTAQVLYLRRGSRPRARAQNTQIYQHTPPARPCSSSARLQATPSSRPGLCHLPLAFSWSYSRQRSTLCRRKRSEALTWK